MRNPKRITPALKAIKKIWKKCPELRLMQLLINTKAGYYTEDEDLIRKLTEYYMGGDFESYKEEDWK